MSLHLVCIFLVTFQAWQGSSIKFDISLTCIKYFMLDVTWEFTQRNINIFEGNKNTWNVNFFPMLEAFDDLSNFTSQCFLHTEYKKALWHYVWVYFSFKWENKLYQKQWKIKRKITMKSWRKINLFNLECKKKKC